jgi:phage tail-like protein
MPQTQDFWESYLVDQYKLIIDATECPGVTKITGLNLGEFDTIEQPHGGSHHVYKISSQKVKFQPLVIERRVDGSPEDKFFMDWFRQTFDLKAERTGGSTIRKSGMVIKRHNGQDVIKFAFYHAWVKSTTFTDLEAGSNNLFVQTITLEHEGLELVEAV